MPSTDTVVESRQRLDHPCPYTKSLLPTFTRFLQGTTRVIDPFAGIGRVHDLRETIPGLETVGVEIEPEWAERHPDTIVGDATCLPFEDNSFDGAVSSPTYGNRMADQHNARDGSHRHTYKHMLGRKLSPNNSGGMQWGEKYRDLHVQAWTELFRVVAPGGRFVLNVSDHIRKGEVVQVSAWHLETLEDIGFVAEEVVIEKTRRMRFGANSKARVEGEMVALLRVPGDG